MKLLVGEASSRTVNGIVAGAWAGTSGHSAFLPEPSVDLGIHPFAFPASFPLAASTPSRSPISIHIKPPSILASHKSGIKQFIRLGTCFCASLPEGWPQHLCHVRPHINPDLIEQRNGPNRKPKLPHRVVDLIDIRPLLE